MATPLMVHADLDFRCVSNITGVLNIKTQPLELYMLNGTRSTS